MGASLDFLVTFCHSLNAVAITFVVISWIFVCYFRTKPIVALAQPTILSLLCIGSLMVLTGNVLAGILSFPGERHSTIDGSMYCSVTFWICWLGVVTILTVLTLKLYHVYRITQSRSGNRVISSHVLGPFGLTIMLAVFLNIAVQVVYPAEYEIHEIPDGETMVPHGVCYPAGSVELTAVVVASLFLQFPFIIAIVVFAWKLRDVNEQLGESRRIFHLGCFTISVYIMYWTLYFVGVYTDDIKKKVYILYGSNIIVWVLHGTSAVGFMIIPRMFYVWYEHAHGHLPEHIKIGTTVGSPAAMSSQEAVSISEEEEKCTEEKTDDTDSV